VVAETVNIIGSAAAMKAGAGTSRRDRVAGVSPRRAHAPDSHESAANAEILNRTIVRLPTRDDGKRV
jgi:hypothetical protein